MTLPDWTRCCMGIAPFSRPGRPPIRTLLDPLAGSVPGGYRDWWDEPDDQAELRAQGEAIERRLVARALLLGMVWQGEILEERRQRERERERRRS